MTDTLQSFCSNSIQVDAVTKEIYGDTVEECNICCRSFGFIVRKNKCKVCGKIYCGKCTNYRVSLPSYVEKQRVCERCRDNVFRDTPGVSAQTVQPTLPLDRSESLPRAGDSTPFQCDEDNIEHVLTRTHTTSGKENMSLSATNVLQAARDSEKRHAGHLLSYIPTTIGPSVSPIGVMTATGVMHRQVTARITPPVAKHSSAPSMSPDRSRCPQRSALQLKERQGTVLCVKDIVEANSAVEEDRSRSGLCDAPESPLLPLRRVFRDPVTGKYIEERDLLLDESLVDDLEPYVVYDSDLDRTFEQGGSCFEDEMSALSKRCTLDDFDSTEPHPAAVTATSNTFARVKRAAYTPTDIAGGRNGFQDDTEKVETSTTALDEDSVYEEDCGSGLVADASELTYHVIITASELERKEALQEERSARASEGVDSPLVSKDETTVADGPEQLGASARLLDTGKEGDHLAYSSQTTCSGGHEYSSSWSAIGQVYRTTLSSKRFSLRLMLLSVAVLMVWNVADNRFAHSSFIASKISTDTLSYSPFILEDGTKKYNHPQRGAGSELVTEGTAAQGDQIIVSDWTAEAPLGASTLRLHIGIRGLQTQCPVSSKRRLEMDAVAASRFQECEGVHHNPYEFPLVTEGWVPSTAAVFLQKQQQLLSLAVKGLLRIPKSIARIFVSVIRRVVGQHRMEIDRRVTQHQDS